MFVPDTKNNEFAITNKLPEHWSLEGGKLYFYAGYKERYFVDDRFFDIDGEHQKEEQVEKIKEHLINRGFSGEEAQEIIDGLPVKEESAYFMSYNESVAWLKSYPEYKIEALRKLQEADASIPKEGELGWGRRR